MSNKKYNATCSICGKPYNMCNSCRHDSPIIWKKFCDTAEHYKIYQIVHGYTTGVYTDAEAAKRLGNVNLSDLDELRPNIRDIINNIKNNIEKTKKRKVSKRTENAEDKDVDSEVASVSNDNKMSVEDENESEDKQ